VADSDSPEPRHSDGQIDSLEEAVEELPEELAAAAETLRARTDSVVARWAIGVYAWILEHAPESARGRVIGIVVMFLVVLAPSVALLYVTLAAGTEATQAWFGRYGYVGVFLANLAGTGTLFIPVPGVTAAGQALIVSSAEQLNPIGVGVAGGLGMAVGEITAYVAGMAGSLVVSEEQIKAPPRLRPLVERVVGAIDWLMDRYGTPTLFALSVIPNPVFELAGLTAGASRFPFKRFMVAVTAGKILRGLLLAYLGELVIFG
jgi:membrane protein DedA with SNARE-associated domain